MGDNPTSPPCSKSQYEQFINTVEPIHSQTPLAALYLLGTRLFLGGLPGSQIGRFGSQIGSLLLVGLPDSQIGPWSLSA